MRSLIGSILDRFTNTTTGGPPVPYSSRAFNNSVFGRGSASSREAQAAAYGGNGTLFAIVGGIAQDVAGLEWKLWRKAKSGKTEDRIQVTSHAAIDVWEKPNDFMARQEYVEVVQQHLDLTGEGWNLLTRGPSGFAPWPVELWPIYPHRMTPIPSAEKFLSGYEYRSPDGQTIPLGLKDVALLRQPHPLDMMRGLGPVEAIGTDLDTAKAAREWNRTFFRNSALPGGVIEYPNGLSDDEWQEQNERWREQHQGVANAHRVATIEYGGKWVDRKYTQQDMQFAELLGLTREAIREAYRYPVAMLGESKDVNRAVAAAQRAIYVEAIVVPRADRWKGFLNHKFLPAFGDTATGLEWDYTSPVPADKEADNAERTSKAQASKTYIEAGFDGESTKIALDLPAALVWEGRHAVTHAHAPGGTQPAPVDPAADPLAEARLRLLGEYPILLNAPRNDAATTDLGPVQEAWQTQLDGLIADWEGVSADQRHELSGQIRTAVDAHDPAALAALTATATAGAALLTAAMVALAVTAAARMVTEAAEQGATITAAAVGEHTLAPVADAAASLLASGLAATAGREALRRYNPQADGTEVAAAVVAVLVELSDAGLRTQLGGALTRAQNLGRLDTIANAAHARLFADERLDANTCTACRDEDGTEFATVADAYAAYGGGAYVACQGGDRCRGTVTALWE